MAGNVADGRDLENDSRDGASVSVSFYFAEEPNPVPDFLIGKRGKNPKVAVYGFHLFTMEPGWELRSNEIDDFLVSTISTFPPDGVTPEWLEEQRCSLVVYISLHSGVQYGDIFILSATLARLAAMGASMRLDAP